MKNLLLSSYFLFLCLMTRIAMFLFIWPGQTAQAIHCWLPCPHNRFTFLSPILPTCSCMDQLHHVMILFQNLLLKVQLSQVIHYRLYNNIRFLISLLLIQDLLTTKRIIGLTFSVRLFIFHLFLASALCQHAAIKQPRNGAFFFFAWVRNGLFCANYTHTLPYHISDGKMWTCHSFLGVPTRHRYSLSSVFEHRVLTSTIFIRSVILFSSQITSRWNFGRVIVPRCLR